MRLLRSRPYSFVDSISDQSIEHIVLEDMKIRYQWLGITVEKWEWNTLGKILNSSAEQHGFNSFLDVTKDKHRGRVWITPTICLSFFSNAKEHYYLNLCPRCHKDIFWLSDIIFCKEHWSEIKLVSKLGNTLSIKPDHRPTYREVLDFFEPLGPLFYEQSTGSPIGDLPTFEKIISNPNGSRCPRSISYVIQNNSTIVAPENFLLRDYLFDNERALSTKLDCWFTESSNLIDLYDFITKL